MWFQVAECDAVNASLLIKFNKQQLSDFLTENYPILNPYLPPKSKNSRPHYSHSSGEKMRPHPAAHPY